MSSGHSPLQLLCYTHCCVHSFSNATFLTTFDIDRHASNSSTVAANSPLSEATASCFTLAVGMASAMSEAEARTRERRLAVEFVQQEKKHAEMLRTALSLVPLAGTHRVMRKEALDKLAVALEKALEYSLMLLARMPNTDNPTRSIFQAVKHTLSELYHFHTAVDNEAVSFATKAMYDYYQSHRTNGHEMQKHLSSAQSAHTRQAVYVLIQTPLSALVWRLRALMDLYDAMPRTYSGDVITELSGVYTNIFTRTPAPSAPSVQMHTAPPPPTAAAPWAAPAETAPSAAVAVPVGPVHVPRLNLAALTEPDPAVLSPVAAAAAATSLPASPVFSPLHTPSARAAPAATVQRSWAAASPSAELGVPPPASSTPPPTAPPMGAPDAPSMDVPPAPSMDAPAAPTAPPMGAPAAPPLGTPSAAAGATPSRPAQPAAASAAGGGASALLDAIKRGSALRASPKPAERKPAVDILGQLKAGVPLKSAAARATPAAGPAVAATNPMAAMLAAVKNGTGGLRPASASTPSALSAEELKQKQEKSAAALLLRQEIKKAKDKGEPAPTAEQVAAMVQKAADEAKQQAGKASLSTLLANATARTRAAVHGSAASSSTGTSSWPSSPTSPRSP
jgi:hypothetical protein